MVCQCFYSHYREYYLRYSHLTWNWSGLGDATPRTFITRTPDIRKNNEKIYTFRYIIPAGSGITSARAPRINYVLQESNNVTGASDTEVALEYNPSSVTMTNETEMRNFSFLRDAQWSGGTSYYTSERPHNLVEGSEVRIKNVQSSNNLTGIANSAFNGKFTVAGISSANTFFVTGPTVDPGTFSNNTSLRTTSLPTFQRTRTKDTFYVYDVQTLREYVSGEQDGIYYMTVVDSSNTPVVAPFNDKDQFSFPHQSENSILSTIETILSLTPNLLRLTPNLHLWVMLLLMTLVTVLLRRQSIRPSLTLV